MNTISFTPQVNNYNGVRIQKQNYNYTNFTGAIKKAPTATQAKETVNLFQRLYKALFLPFQGDLKAIKDGHVFTESLDKEAGIRTSKKFKLWSNKQEAVIQDDLVNKIRRRTNINPDGTQDLFISDVYTPGYNVVVGYKDVAGVNPKTAGRLKLKYGESELELSKEQRHQLGNEFATALEKKFPKSLTELKELTPEELDKYIEGYFTAPEHTASAIVFSPESLNEQLENVPRSLPYGIECIMQRCGKL